MFKVVFIVVAIALPGSQGNWFETNWPTSVSASKLGRYSQSVYWNNAASQCSANGFQLLDPDSPDVRNNPDDLNTFARANFDYDQDYWVFGEPVDGLCPTVKYVNSDLVWQRTKSCSTDIVRVFCSTGLQPVLSWANWIRWTECTASCGRGQRMRIRICEGEDVPCDRHLGLVDDANITYEIESSSCNEQLCPVSGSWLSWGEWSGCNGTCDQALQTRRRACDGPYHGGRDCYGDNVDKAYCDLSEEMQAECDKQDKSRHDGLKDEGPAYKESDSRPSAVGTGAVSLILVITELCILLLADLITCKRHFVYCYRSLRFAVRKHRSAMARHVVSPLPSQDGDDRSDESLTAQRLINRERAASNHS